MGQALAARPAADFQRPDTVVSVTIDPETGFLAAPDCPQKRDEFFIAGSEPTAYCPKHGGDILNPLPPSAPTLPDAGVKEPETGPEGAPKEEK